MAKTRFTEADKKFAESTLTTVLAWGVGGFLMVLGAVFLILGDIYNLKIPALYIVGGVVMSAGTLCWIVSAILKTIKDIKLKIKE